MVEASTAGLPEEAVRQQQTEKTIRKQKKNVNLFLIRLVLMVKNSPNYTQEKN